jgi:hypothetical protein
MGGGRGKLMCISTAATVGRGMTITNTRKIVPKSNLLIFLPPSLSQKRPFAETICKTRAIRFGHLAMFLNLSTY